jgi:parallel beta-helix repeat protein
MKLVAFVLTGAALTACGGSSDDPCKGVTGTCVPVEAGASVQEVQTDLINATSGTTIAFGAGTFDFDLDLSLIVGGVTIQGEGMDKTILNFKNQTSGQQGLLVQTNGSFAIHDIAFQDPPGNCIKMEGVNGLTVDHVRTEWTAGPSSTNGAYGIYPVQCSNVLIQNSVAKGASDTGIYVGQSHDVIVRNNDVEYNVAGIESENTNNDDIYMNTATHNAGGILVFNLPGLQVENAGGTRVFMNMIVDNNTTNFAPSGNIVGMVPTGSGFVGLAAHNLEIFNNTFDNEKSMNLGIASYTIIGNPMDANYNVYPDTIYIHDNQMSGAMNMPTGPLGALIILALDEIQPAPPVPDMIWDGVVDPTKALSTDPNQLMPQYNICIGAAGANGAATWGDLHWPNNQAPIASLDPTNFQCTHPALPPVVIPGA